jgi:shikimate dehydrogenase
VLARLLAGADLLVDATPRGLDAAAALIDLAPLPAGATVVDLAVRRETALVKAARARGLRAVGGEAMLLHQGARSLELWTGRPAPIEVMRAALSAALARPEPHRG